MKDEGLIQHVYGTVGPTLTFQNAITRLAHCIQMLSDDLTCFQPMFDYVHVDEKYFYICKAKQGYSIVRGEATPARYVQNRRILKKVMVLMAVARPRYVVETGALFDGKIGCFTFTGSEPAKRSSRNRPKETLVMKATESINRNEYVRVMMEKVIPAITLKWPQSSKSMPIRGQHDNAPPHSRIDRDEAIARAASSDGWNISV